LEYALTIRDNHPETRIRTISLGDRFAEEGLKRSIAMGADEAIHIEYEDCEALDAWAAASILAPACGQADFDLILCGASTLDGNAGLVGQYVAETLIIPHMSRVIRIEVPGNGGQAQIHRRIERGDRQILTCRLPALFSIQKGTTVPRYPKLAGFLRAENQPVVKLKPKILAGTGGEAQPVAPMTEILELVKPRPKKKEEEIEKKKMSAMDRLKAISKREPSKKKDEGNIVDGGSDQMFTKLDRILKEAGVFVE
jgi:electron transfer flavoprotein beta subunit